MMLRDKGRQKGNYLSVGGTDRAPALRMARAAKDMAAVVLQGNPSTRS